MKHKYQMQQLDNYENLLLSKIDYKPSSILSINTRKKIQLFITISPKLQYRWIYRSPEKRLRAAEKHITSPDWYIIHPYSLFQYYWLIMMTFVYFMAMLTIPCILADPSSLNQCHYMQFLLDLIFIVDIVKTFNTGYVEDSTDDVIMDKHEVIKKYLKTRFLMDVLSSIPYLNVKDISLHLSVLKLLKLGRAGTFNHLLDNLMHNLGCKQRLQDAIFLAILTALSLHWLINLKESLKYILALINPQQKYYLLEDKDSNWYDHFHKLLAANKYDPSFTIVSTCYTIFSILVFSYWILKVTNFIVSILSLKNDLKLRINKLENFLAIRKVPNGKRDKIICYYKNCLENKDFKDEVLNAMLNQDFYKSYKYLWVEKIFNKLALLKGLPPHILERIKVCLVPKIYCPDDEIIKPGTKGDCTYFLITGQVAVIRNTGPLTCHLYDGDVFGHAALLVPGEPRLTRVVAVDFCEVFLLYSKDFDVIVCDCKELGDRVMGLLAGGISDRVFLQMERVISGPSLL